MITIDKVRAAQQTAPLAPETKALQREYQAQITAKARATRMRKKHEAFQRAEDAAKAEIIALGYGPRFYAGKCHAIEGLKPGETYYQEQFHGGYGSWQETLESLRDALS